MNVIVQGFVAMSVTLAYIALAILVLGGLRIAVPAPKTPKGMSPAQRRKHRDNVITAHLDYVKFTGFLWTGLTLLYPATVGLVAVFRLS